MAGLLLILFSFVAVCFGNGHIPIKVGILYSNEDPIADIAIRNIEVRYKLMTNYAMRAYTVNIRNMDSFTIDTCICDMIQKGVHGVVGPVVDKANSIVQSVSENFELLQIQTFWNPALGPANNESAVLNLYPEPSMLGKALATLVSDMNWKSFAVIYEDDDGLVRLQEVLKLRRANADDFPVTIRKLFPGDDQSALLKEIKAGSETRIILDCRTERIIAILQQAQKIYMLEDYYSYILTSLDAHTLDFSDLKSNGSNITTLRMIATNKNPVRNVIRDWEFMEEQFGRSIKIDPESVKLSTALLYDALECFLTTFIELSSASSFSRFSPTPLNCEKKNTSSHGFHFAEYQKLRPLYNGTLSEPLSGTIEFDSFGRRKNFKLQMVSLYNNTFRQNGEWSSEDPYYIKNTLSVSNTTHYFADPTLSSKTVYVASRLGAPYLMPKPTNNTDNPEYEGYVADLIKEIAKLMSFDYKLYVPLDSSYGSINKVTKEWNGLIKEIIDRKAHFAACDLTITYERGRAVDFSVPFMTLGISILYSKAAKKPPDLLSFMKPLSLDIWLFMATAYLIMSIIIYFTARLSPRDWENPHPCDSNPTELENVWTIQNSFWLTLGSIMTQGCDILPKGLSTRMICSMWWFFSLIITSSYTANLAAFLTNERMGPSIESAEDLAKQSDIKYGCVQDGATAAFFRDSNFTTYQRMWRTMQSEEPSVFQKSNADGVRNVKIRKRMYAFFMESSTIEYEKERDCELTQVGGWLDTKGYGIAMPINSPYRTEVNEAILKLQEDGTLRKLKEKWWKNEKSECSKSEGSKEESATELGIDHVGGMFVVLTGGLILAFLVAIFEFLWSVQKIAVERHAWHDQLCKDMEDAAVEKATLARERGDVDPDGIPFICVCVDGGWSHRSYGDNYNASSGVGVIIGRHTSKVLYVGIRNKYCIVCARAANKKVLPKQHKCFRNWSGSSSATEADIIVEGFRFAEETYRMHFKSFVADGDSSVYAKIVERVPYGRMVKKIERVNHAIKNYGKLLFNIKKTPKFNWEPGNS